MQKKKILAGLSALALMAILAVGCGSSAKQASPDGRKSLYMVPPDMEWIWGMKD